MKAWGLGFRVWGLFGDWGWGIANLCLRFGGFGLEGEAPFGTNILEAPVDLHTVDYEPFITSQLAQTESTLRPYVVKIWPRYPQ